MIGLGSLNWRQAEPIVLARIRATDYLTVAQLFLRDNFLLSRPLEFADIKPRLLGHWGTCHGINAAIANLAAYFSADFLGSEKGSRKLDKMPKICSNIVTETGVGGLDKTAKLCSNVNFILGPGHGFPALQANLWLDGTLELVDPKATRDYTGLAYLCRNFSWPEGFPSHASPLTPGVVCEGGELGYALGAAYGLALGHPEKTVAVLIGDGELETATALASLNLVKLMSSEPHGRVLPILHLNGYKISGPTVYGRKSPRELAEMLRGFGYIPLIVDDAEPAGWFEALDRVGEIWEHRHDGVREAPLIIFKSEKGAGGPKIVDRHKVAGNYLAHQIPLPNAKTDKTQLSMLEDWLKSYRFDELEEEIL